jgi:hypothetical protein
MFRSVSAFVLGLLVVSPAVADGMVAPRYYQPRYSLPPERHVIEVVQPPWSGNFIINGHRFSGKTPACLSWAAGEQITLVAGDWHGRCVDAVFYNYPRRSTCEVSCGWGRY